MPDLGPETELLVRSCSVQRDEAWTAAVRSLSRRDLDWDTLVRRASWHGVLPLLATVLKSSCAGSTASDVIQNLQGLYHSHARRSLYLAGELGRILRSLDVRGITAIPFKGPTLAAYAYGHPALRQAGDLDILVRSQDLERARAQLASLGFEFCTPGHAHMIPALLRGDYEFRLFRKSDGVAVGLHWNLWPGYFRLPLAAMNLWQDAEPFRIAADTAVLTPAPDRMLLLLCAHAAKHYWVRMIFVSDVAHLVRRRTEMDWGRLLRDAREFGLLRVLLVGLALARDLSGLTLPREATAAAGRDSRLHAVVADRQRNILADAPRYYGEAEGDAFMMLLRERIRDRLPLYMARVHRTDWNTSLPTDAAFLQLPESLSAMYRLFHPLRFAGKYVVRPLRRLLRRLQSLPGRGPTLKAVSGGSNT